MTWDTLPLWIGCMLQCCEMEGSSACHECEAMPDMAQYAWWMRAWSSLVHS